MPLLPLPPLSVLQFTKHIIPKHNLLPNSHPHNLPLLIYHRVFPQTSTASQIETHLRTINAVSPQWRYSMYPYTHFHSTTHEVLCVYKGRAKLLFGGEGNKNAVEVVVGKGDVIVVPAGVGHRLLEEVGGIDEEGSETSHENREEKERFEMVGSYPVGAEQWDMCYGKEGEEDKVKRIKDVKWFEKDPVYGDEGPVLDVGKE